MKLLKTIVALSAVTVSMPALAVSYDAYRSFTGANGAGGFTYGYTDGVTGTAFDTTGANGGCAYNAAPGVCLYSSTSANGNIPTVEKGGAFATVAPSGNRLKVHPGDSSALTVYATFTAGVAGRYSYDISLQSIGTDTTNGVGATFYVLRAGGATVSDREVIGYTETASTSGTLFLNAGESIGALVDYNGSYGGDSTALSFRLAVPEPATWGMMVLGFGLVGAGMRSRRRATAAA